MTKSIFASKTLWGGLIMILPTLLAFFNVDITPTEIQTGAEMAQAIVVKGSEFVGFVLVIIGRFKAVKSLSVTGG